MDLPQGDPRRLGEYEVVRRLGAGGMGVVFLARAASGRPVAIKLVHAELARDPEFRSRFRGEVARVRQVPPFCTAEVIDADPDAARPYLVVEYVAGPSLAEEVTARGPLSASNLHALAIGTATALTAIHEAGVIHRDLKPGNVLLAPGSPKVIDFGISRALEGTPGQDTRSGQFVGTVGYMAPERFEGGAVTPAADVFAWGCVVAYAGTGRAPFDANTSVATLARILTRPPELDGLPAGPLRALVERALVTDPALRPTARELLDALLSNGAITPPPSPPVTTPAVSAIPAPGAETATEPHGGATTTPHAGPATPPARPRPTRRTALAALAGALTLALLGTAGVVAYRNATAAEKATGIETTAGGQAVDPGYGLPGGAPATPPVPPSAPATATPSATPPAPTGKPGPSTEAPPRATPPAGRKNQPVIKAKDRNGVAAYGPYFIHNTATRRCVDLYGDSGGAPDEPVKQDICITVAENNQEYQFVPHGADPAGNQLYRIRNVDDDLCLDVPGTGAVPPATQVIEMTCNEQDNQDFRLESRSTRDGWENYHLINTASTMCLDVYGVADPAPALPLTLVPCVTTDDHEWALIEKSEW